MLTDDGRTDGRMDGRTPDACIYYKLTYETSAQVSRKYKIIDGYNKPMPSSLSLTESEV